MMSDYYSLLRKAIAGLDRPDERARRELYERARKALVRQLQDAGRPDIDEQLEALQAAAARIENDLEGEVNQEIAPRRTREHGHPVVVQPTPDTGAPRRWVKVAAGGMAFVILIGFGAYYFGSRDRTRPTPATRSEPARPAPSVDGSAVVTDADNASYLLRRQRVYYRTSHPPGTIIVSRSQRFLYLVQPNQVAIRYAIAVGRECEGIAGAFRVIEKIDGPGTAGGASDPAAKGEAGRFAPPALYFGQRRAVHDATEPQNIGGSSTAGCFQSWKQDIVDLYGRVPLNERVVVAN